MKVKTLLKTLDEFEDLRYGFMGNVSSNEPRTNICFQDSKGRWFMIPVKAYYTDSMLTFRNNFIDGFEGFNSYDHFISSLIDREIMDISFDLEDVREQDTYLKLDIYVDGADLVYNFRYHWSDCRNDGDINLREWELE